MSPCLSPRYHVSHYRNKYFLLLLLLLLLLLHTIFTIINRLLLKTIEFNITLSESFHFRIVSLQNHFISESLHFRTISYQNRFTSEPFYIRIASLQNHFISESLHFRTISYQNRFMYHCTVIPGGVVDVYAWDVGHP